jgi:TPR repeat protein
MFIKVRVLAFAGLAFLSVAGEPACSGALSEGRAAYQRGDYVRAAADLLPLAKSGNAEAQAAAGFMYQHGFGVPQNLVIAAHWYHLAAEQGNPWAQYELGLLYDKGHGVPRSAVIAYAWLNLAAAHARPNMRDYYLRIRNAVASKLTEAQIAESQWLAYSWTAGRGP